MARIALGSNVKEGPRRGEVVGHRPKGMVDVQFDDVGWVERRQESGLRRSNPYPDTKKPKNEQLRRVQNAIYQKERKKRGVSDQEAWRRSFAFAVASLQERDYLKEGTLEPTAKGRRRSKQKLKTPDAWAKGQQYELGLGRHRKSGKFRVAPTRHGSQLRYYVQPGGQYFYGKGAKARAESLRDDLNGVGMPKRMAMAANPHEYELRENWLPAAAAALTVADVGYRAFRDRKKGKKGKKDKKKKENPKMYAGIHKIGYYWATVRSAKPGEYIAPMILADHDPATGKKVYYFAFESKNKRRVSALEQAARQAGLRGTSMSKELEGSPKQRQRGHEPIYIFKTTSLKTVQQLAILLNRRNIGYKVEPQALFRQLAQASIPKAQARRKPTGLEHKSMAELAAQRKALMARKAKRANPTGNGPITRKADLKRDEQYTIWLKMASGTFVVERSYPGGYIQDAMWTDIKAYNRQNTRQYVVVEQGIDPNTGYRQNFVGAAIRGGAAALRGGAALIKTPLGKKIAAEVTAIASVLLIEKATSKAQKLVSEGKIDPQVLSYVQRRIEQKTGKKPSKAKVSEVLAAMDPNKDKTLTATEVVKGFGKTKTNRRR